MQKITPFIWFEKDAAAIAEYYVGIFKDAKITSRSVMDNTPSGSVEIMGIELFGQAFTLMSAGPQFKLTEAVSFVVSCEDQAEVDHYWEALTTDGGEPGQCGWLKDRYGLSWQIVPTRLGELMGGSDPAGAGRASQAMLSMQKLDIAGLEKAYGGK